MKTYRQYFSETLLLFLDYLRCKKSERRGSLVVYFAENLKRFRISGNFRTIL